jgi:hypothetical protein
MTCRACVVCLLALTVAARPAPAQVKASPAGDPKIKIALELAPVIWKIVQPVIEDYVLKTETGQSAEVRIFPTVRDSKLVFARKKMEVHTSHWSNNRFGEIYLDSYTDCEAFYSVDMSKVKCFYYPGKKLLKVLWPGTDILTITPELADRRQSIKYGGMRFSPVNHDVVRGLEAQVPEAVKRCSTDKAKNYLSELDRDAREALLEVFQKAAQKLDPDIEVVVEAPK